MVSDTFAGVPHFVAVARARSFKAAAESLGISSAAVSRAVRRLEAELGLRLLRRTTRRVSLTPEGELFFERCARAVELVEGGRELMALSRGVAVGTLTVSLPHIYGTELLRRLPTLRERLPSLRISLRSTDRMVDLAEEGIDVAIRIGHLRDSALVGTRIRRTRWVTVASPAYLDRVGVPERPEALQQHACLKFRRADNRLVEFEFDMDGRRERRTRSLTRVATPTTLDIDQGEQLLQACVAGLGVCQALDFMVQEQLAHGELVEVLRPYAGDGPPVHALVLPNQREVPRIRAFLDLLQA